MGEFGVIGKLVEYALHSCKNLQPALKAKKPKIGFEEF